VRRAAAVSLGLLLVLGAGSALAQTSTSTSSGVRYRSQKLQEDLQRWEGGDRGEQDVFDVPFGSPDAQPEQGGAAPAPAAPPAPPAPPAAFGLGSDDAPAPGGARVDVVGPPRAPPVTAPAQDDTPTAVKFDQRLYSEGEAQRIMGRNLLIGGIPTAVAGLVLGIAGYGRTISNILGDNRTNGYMMLGGLGLGATGAGLIVAGAISFHRGGKKMRQAGAETLSAVAPLMLDGEVRGAQAVFTF